ncbi:uncharacterized protein [Ptychodera flava]|uniref:uncharacterized protein n=1 Tax=Ptychodera flava TaxID=63121 RepID=UPI00396A54D6
MEQDPLPALNFTKFVPKAQNKDLESSPLLIQPGQGTPTESGETVTPTSNQQTPTTSQNNNMQPLTEIAQMMACQRLPLQQPITFGGDPTMYMSLKRSFEATGDPQKIVEDHLQRYVDDPDESYREAWIELEDRFGNPAVITAVILERLKSFPKVKPDESKKLLELSDLCSNTEVHMRKLPDLSSLNTPQGLKPVMEKLPRFVLNKWRDNVASYKRRHKTFPPFKFFKDFLKDTAKAACDPDIPRPDDTHPGTSKSKSSQHTKTRVLVHATKSSNEEKQCLFHEAKGHDLKDCKAFAKQPVADRIELCKKKGLCFKCTEKHLAKDCTSTIECVICKSKKHITCLHATPGDRSKQKATETKPEDKVKETKEATTNVPDSRNAQPDVQNDNIPSDKNEIPTPDICKTFKHLKPIIDYIPEPKKNVGIHLLIGRNCPEPLKVRETRNGPVNSPWAQRTDLGWTISGELCLETARGVIRTSVHRTTATLNSYDESALECNPHIHIKDIISPKPVNFGTTVFKRTPYDEQKAPSIEDKQFLDIMQQEVHVNEEGNLELPLPFRQDPKKLPNNRQSALNRFYNLQNHK